MTFGRAGWACRHAMPLLLAGFSACTTGARDSNERIAQPRSQALVLAPRVPIENIELEVPASIVDVPPSGRTCNQRLDYTDNTRHYPLRLEGSPCDAGPPSHPYAQDKPYVSPRLHYGSGHSLQLTLPPRAGSVAPDTVEVIANASGDEAAHGVGFNFENPKYVGVAVRIDSSSDLPLSTGGIDFMRVRQTNGSCGVPFSARLISPSGAVATTPLQPRFVAADSLGAYALPLLAGVSTPLIRANEWHSFVFYLQPVNNQMQAAPPANDRTGVISVWLDGVLIADWHHDWGCNVSGADPTAGAFELGVGVNRATTGSINKWLYGFFDNIRVAPSFLLADPARSPDFHFEGAVSVTELSAAERQARGLSSSQCDVKLQSSEFAADVALEGSVCSADYFDPTLLTFRSRPDSPEPYIHPTEHFDASPRGNAGDHQSIELTLPPRLTAASPDRAELIAAADDDTSGVGFGFDRPRYFGFAMQVHPSSSFPLAKDVTFMQAWQINSRRDSGGGRCGVPLTATLKAGGAAGSLPFEVRVRRDADPNEFGTVIASRTLALRTIGEGANQFTTLWHSFLFQLYPRSVPQTTDPTKKAASIGKVKIWLDGIQIADFNGTWGCNEGPSPFGTISDQWQLRVGMLRAAPNTSIGQTMYTFFDNVRVSSLSERANPEALF